MFVLKKLVTPFLKPPGVFIAGLFIAAAVLAMRRHRKSAAAALAAGLILWLPAIAPVEDLLLAGLMRNVPRLEAPIEGDAIVLLGGGIDDQAMDTFGSPGVTGRYTNGRIITAARLYRRLRVPVIVSGGRPYGERVSEAEVNARILVDLGVASEHILLEENSRDTRENAEQVAIVCRARGVRRILLVTSAFHLRRASLMFASTGLEILPVSDRSSHAGRYYRWVDFLPTSYERTSLYLHEYLGILAHRFTN